MDVAKVTLENWLYYFILAIVIRVRGTAIITLNLHPNQVTKSVDKGER